MGAEAGSYFRKSFKNPKASIANRKGSVVFLQFVEITPDALLFESNSRAETCKAILAALTELYEGKKIDHAVDDQDSFEESITITVDGYNQNISLQLQLILDDFSYLVKVLTVVR